MIGVQPRPLRHRGRSNRRGRKAVRLVRRRHVVIHAADPKLVRSLVEDAPWFAGGAR